MGTLRTLFALAVVLAHPAGGFEFSVGARGAVQLFYVISGFLISYVLTEARSYRTAGDFYLSRWLRLYPTYAAVALLSLASEVLKDGKWFDLYRQIPASAEVLLVFSNLFLFGQDWVLFSAVHNGTLEFSTNFTDTDYRLHRGLLVPQAWTIGIELSFYAIAPFILLRRRLLFSLLIASLALRVALVAGGLGLKDPWTYRFFPTELALFIFGAVSHQIVLPYIRAKFSDAQRMSRVARRVTWFLIVLAAGYALLPLEDPYRTLLLYTTFILLLPFSFLFQNEHTLDSRIGDLSYPIYIGHLLVQRTIDSILAGWQIAPGKATAIGGAILSIGFAYVLNKVIGERVDAVRIRLRQA
jgi:peptidoglycan/LPS O-acetylase OafA/YrhL